MSTPLAHAPDAPLLRHDADGVCTLTLNRPAKYNTLSMAMLGALGAELAAIAGDASVRVVILASTGKAFCTGHDLKELRATREEAYYREVLATCSAMMQAIVALPQPVIASVQGIATAAGCQLVASCDLAIASDEARFATSGINYGLFCSTPAVALSRNVARKHALEMLYTGARIDAAEAHRLGIVDHVVPRSRLLEKCADIAEEIVRSPPLAVEKIRDAVMRGVDVPLRDALEIERENFDFLRGTEDAVEGAAAFAAKRPPVWRGR